MNATEQDTTVGSQQWALRTASAVKGLWRDGNSPDLVSVLETYPGLKRHATVVVDLAYEEYWLRLKAGETPDASEFARRFPTFERAIACYLMVRSLVDKDARCAAMGDELAWPEPGRTYLGLNVIREIGRGAVGRVYLATENALGGRRVAVKVTVEGGHEANILGQLEHANIVPVYSIRSDEDGKLTAFCMPYFGQATLAGVLDRLYARRRPPARASALVAAIQAINEGEDVGRLPELSDRRLDAGSYVDGVIRLGLQLAEALAHAHAHGIGHRDLKPQNILMAPDGRPLLLDFNLSVDDRSPVWKLGGTLPYMAPEELRKVYKLRTSLSRYDLRSDLFSLGVILFELLTGEMPFGEIKQDFDVQQVAKRLRKRQAKGPKSLRKLNVQVDARLAELIEHCLAFDPEERPASADAVSAALRRELTISRRARRWAIDHRGLVLATVFLVFLAAAAITTYLAHRPPYSVRLFRQGLAYSAAGQDDLALQSLTAVLRVDPRASDILVARAGVYKHQRDFNLAFADYETAAHVAPRPEIDACEGYCLNQLDQHQQAAASYRRAIQGGYDTPAVLNNLGYCWLRLGQLDDALACLRRAAQADDTLQAAHHNLVVVYLQRALVGTAIPPEAFQHARRALEIGPKSGELFRNLAFFYAIAAKDNGDLIQESIANVAQAVAYGVKPSVFESDPVFATISSEPAFRDALTSPGAALGPARSVRLIDPDGAAR